MEELTSKDLRQLAATLEPSRRVLAYVKALTDMCLEGMVRASCTSISSRVRSEHPNLALRPPETGPLLRRIGLSESLYTGKRYFVLDAKELAWIKSYFEDAIKDIERKLKDNSKAYANDSARIDNLKQQFRSLQGMNNEVAVLEDKLRLRPMVERRLAELRLENQSLESERKALEEEENRNKQLLAFKMRSAWGGNDFIKK
jgi:hypothetical protein